MKDARYCENCDVIIIKPKAEDGPIYCPDCGKETEVANKVYGSAERGGEGRWKI